MQHSQPVHHDRVRRRLWTRGCFASLFMCCLCLSSLVAHAQRYVQVTAELQIVQATWQADVETTTMNKQGSTNEWSISFACTVGTNEWELDGNFSKNARSKWFFDGTNVYHSIQITQEPEEHHATNSQFGFFFPPLERVRSNLTVNIHTTPGGYPRGDVGVNVPWLAFGSGSFLKRSDRIIPMPVAIIGHAPDVFAYSDRTETFDDELGLPRTVELFTSQSRYEASVNEFWKNKAGRIPKREITDGLSAFHYTVTQSTNFLGWSFPLAFEFAGVREEFPGVLRSHSGRGRVVAINSSSRPKGVFDPSLNQTVMDRRFREELGETYAVVYESTNTFAPPMDDPTLQARFEETAKRALERRRSKPAESQSSPKQ